MDTARKTEILAEFDALCLITLPTITAATVMAAAMMRDYRAMAEAKARAKMAAEEIEMWSKIYGQSQSS